MKGIVTSMVTVLMLFIIVNITPVISATNHNLNTSTCVSYTAPTYTLTAYLDGCTAEYTNGEATRGGGTLIAVKQKFQVYLVLMILL